MWSQISNWYGNEDDIACCCSKVQTSRGRRKTQNKEVCGLLEICISLYYSRYLPVSCFFINNGLNYVVVQDICCIQNFYLFRNGLCLVFWNWCSYIHSMSFVMLATIVYKHFNFFHNIWRSSKNKRLQWYQGICFQVESS